VLSPRRLEVLAGHGQMAWRDGNLLPTWWRIERREVSDTSAVAGVKKGPAKAGSIRA
jgi:hypothetical protein